MGYSIAAHATSIGALRKMKAFMKKNFQPPSKLFGEGEDYMRFATNDAPRDERLSYDHNKLAIGFDYSALGDPEWNYIFSVTRWMALKIGKRRAFKGLGTVPYYRYDGCENTPILVDAKDVPKEWAGTVTDAVGFRPMLKIFEGHPKYEDSKTRLRFLIMRIGVMLECGMGPTKIDHTIKKELNRLDKLWQETMVDATPEEWEEISKAFRFFVHDDKW